RIDRDRDLVHVRNATTGRFPAHPPEPDAVPEPPVVPCEPVVNKSLHNENVLDLVPGAAHLYRGSFERPRRAGARAHAGTRGHEGGRELTGDVGTDASFWYGNSSRGHGDRCRTVRGHGFPRRAERGAHGERDRGGHVVARLPHVVERPGPEPGLRRL